MIASETAYWLERRAGSSGCSPSVGSYEEIRLGCPMRDVPEEPAEFGAVASLSPKVPNSQLD